ncbi:MAG: hypothetical protein JWN93_3051 [Hyphomicrobiales bacterium]|nr:hypothetical protein [Hyphomicrobiales bacterium]
MRFHQKRRGFLAALVAMGALCASGGHVAAQSQKPETPNVTVGLSVNDSTFLPIYLAEAAGFYKAEGLNVKVLAFRGGSDLTRALVAGSVHIGVAAPTSVLAAINAGENVKVFFGGFNQAPFFWFAAPPIKTMAEVKGKRIGITRFGSSTDALTRFALTMAKLDPKTDVRIVQGGGSAERLAAMETKQIDAGIFTWPHNFAAEDRGYNLIARQSDFMPDFPIQSFYAMQAFIDKNPQTLKAALRAFIRAVRLAREDRGLSVKTLVSRAGLEEKYAGRAYDQLIDGWREDGRLATEDGMKKFFDMAIAAGDVDSPWPREKYWDDRFAASIDDWKP